MPTPSDLLQVIETSIDHVLQEDGLNPQQATFVNHIRKTAAELSKALAPIPQTEHALRRILPSFGDSFVQQQAALFGYARLLLEQPDSFAGAILSDYQQAQMQQIYQYGQALYQLTLKIHDAAQTERRQQHKAKASMIDLDTFFADEAPILHYLVHDVPVQLTLAIDPICVYANRYHLAALIQHIVTVLSHDLIEYGQIKINTAIHQHQSFINIFCTGIQLNPNEIDSLFKKNGRYLYSQRLLKDGGHIHFIRDTGRGATIQLALPNNKQ